jgi:hypothetical protein
VTIPAVTALEREEMTLRLPLPEQMARLIR